MAVEQPEWFHFVSEPLVAPSTAPPASQPVSAPNDGSEKPVAEKAKVAPIAPPPAQMPTPPVRVS